MKITVVSNGMGTQSKLIPLLLYEKNPRLQEYWQDATILNVFADTGDEPENIYQDVIEYQNYLRKHNYSDLIIINRKMTHGLEQDRMSEYFLEKGIIPTRQFRHCTDRFKIQVIRRFLRLYMMNFPAETEFDIRILIGFTIDEAHRMRDSDVKWVKNEFPFIYNLKYTRKDCIRELDKRGLHSHKSGCWYCPYLSFKRFHEYVKDRPEDKKLIIEMEGKALLKNNKMTLFNLPVAKLIHNKEMQKDLSSYFDENDTCDSGYCFI